MQRGHLLNVGFSCGWSLIGGAGQLIGWQGMVSLIPRFAPYVIKRKKISSIFSLPVCLQGRCGHLLRFVGLEGLAPQPTETSFDDWWEMAEMRVNGDTRAGLNLLIILGPWTIWRHRNDCVFNGLSPCIIPLCFWPGMRHRCGTWLGLRVSQIWVAGIG